MFCPQCGTQVPDQARFCPKCGHAVLQYTPENQEKDFSRVQREPSISALAQFKIGLGFIIAAVLVASGVCLGMEDVLAALLYSVGILAVGAGIGVVLIVISLKGVTKHSQDQIQEYKAYTEKWGGLLKVIPAIFVAALIVRCISSFSGVDPNTSLADFGVESMTANIALSDTFDQTDLAITPVAVSYVSNGIFYDTYGDLHASIALDITCLGSSWAPTYEDVTFWVDGSASFKSEFDHTEIKRGETFRYTFTHPLITSTVQDVDMRLKLKCKTGATIELYFTIDDIQDSPIFSGEGLYNDFVETNEASFHVPEVGRSIDPTEFDGVYANVDNQNELLIIDWYDFALTLSCYNNETTFFDLVNVDPYDWSAEIPFSGNKIVAAPDTLLPSMYESNYNYNITYTYVPRDLSPYGVDTIYMESADFKNAVFVRTKEAKLEGTSEEGYEPAQPGNLNPGAVSEADPLTYFIEHCDTEYFSEADLAGFDADMCRIARNGIYARSGRKFSAPDLQTYFEKFDWYYPMIEPNDFQESMLNEHQIANRDLVIAYEGAQGYR